MMLSFKLLLSYRGLPTSWATNGAEISSASKMKLDKASKKILESYKGGTVFVHGDASLLLSSLSEDSEYLKDFVGLDFREYFDAKMDKDKVPKDLVTRRFTFIYGVGNESALNKQFSGQLLRGLLEQCRQEGVWCFVCSDVAKTTFSTDYSLNIKNNLTLPKREEDDLL